jgi:hypothetical protein
MIRRVVAVKKPRYPKARCSTCRVLLVGPHLKVYGQDGPEQWSLRYCADCAALCGVLHPALVVARARLDALLRER